MELIICSKIQIVSIEFHWIFDHFAELFFGYDCVFIRRMLAADDDIRFLSVMGFLHDQCNMQCRARPQKLQLKIKGNNFQSTAMITLKLWYPSGQRKDESPKAKKDRSRPQSSDINLVQIHF